LQRLLDHLEEAGFYSTKDLSSITKTLADMHETLERGRDTYSPALLTLLESRLDKCQLKLEKLQSGLAKLSPELASTHETILRSTSAVNTRSKFSASEVNGLREQLKKIEDTTKDGTFVDASGNPLPNQEDVKLLLHRCWRWSDIVLERLVPSMFVKIASFG
jgi:septation ring formation regulator EzrA